MDGDEIGLPQQVLLAAGKVDAHFAALVRGQVLAPRGDLHAERLGDVRDAGAQLAEPDDAERLALEVEADRALPQLARLHARILMPNPPSELEHQADRDASGRTADRRRSAHYNVARLGGFE